MSAAADAVRALFNAAPPVSRDAMSSAPPSAPLARAPLAGAVAATFGIPVAVPARTSQGASANKHTEPGKPPAAVEAREHAQAMNLDDLDNVPPPEGFTSRVRPDAGARSANDAPIMPRLLDLRKLDAQDPGAPPFIVPGWIPEHEVTLLAGHGGAGKSFIALHLAACIALGRDWYGIHTERRRVLYLSLEDGQRRLHWRLKRIADSLGVRIADLAQSLYVADGSDEDGAIMTETRDGLALTGLAHSLAEEVKRSGARVLIVDGVSDAFDASEIVRRYVRRFVRLLRGMIPPDGAAILLAHVDKASALKPDTAQGFSGSTQWHNSVRSRLYLRPDAGGDQILESQKVQDGQPGAQIRIRWNGEAQVFVGEPVVHAGPLARGLADAEAKGWILDALRKAAAAGDPVPAACSGPGRKMLDALKARADYPDVLKAADGDKRARRLVEELRSAGVVIEGQRPGKDRHPRRVLLAVQPGEVRE